jgi:hypothetical protein
VKADTKKGVRLALLANAALVSLLGGTRVYQVSAPHLDEYPRITLFEVDNRDEAFADDESYGSEVSIQVDIWSKEITTEMAVQVDSTMKTLGFRRTSAADLYEHDTKINHKAMRYRTLIEEE